nr:MAG TPA: EutP [Caudoviricetes sp.]
MAKIIYFGTEGNGKSGHYPIGIDKHLTNEEYKKRC